MNMNQDFYSQSPTPVRREYGAAQKWLLAVALIIGIAFDRALFANGGAATIAEFTGRYFIFWASYIVSLYVFMWDRIKSNTDSWFLIAAVFLLFGRALVYKEQVLALVNLAVIPLVLMLHAAVAHHRYPAGQEGRYMLAYIKGWFVWPFSAIGSFFGALGAVFGKNSSKNRNKLAVGLLIAVPVVIVVMSLLLSADRVMDYYFNELFTRFRIDKFAGHLLLAAAAAILFYSFLYNAVFAQTKAAQPQSRPQISHISVSVVIGSLLFVYAVFAYIQFAYLFGSKGLPEGLTYSEYARSGFSQLLMIAAINIAVFGISLNYSSEGGAKKCLLLGLLAATGVVLASGMLRLGMYIDAYGLTVFRILPMWFMIYLGITIALCAAKLFLKKLPLLRLCAIALVVWYLVLNAVNLDAMVAASILKKAQATGVLSENDRAYISELSSDADAMRAQYRELLNAK